MTANFRVEDDPGFFFNHSIATLPISSKAIGIYVRIRLLCSYPGWNFSISGLSKIIPEGKEAILTGLRELEQVGLLRRTQERLDNGLMGPAIWVIYGKPQPVEEVAGEPATDNPPTVDPPTVARRLHKNISNKNESKKENPPTPLAPEPERVAPPPSMEPVGMPTEPERDSTLRLKIIPEPLLPFRHEILTFWDSHKGGKKTQKAWDSQMVNLLKILNDKEGGASAVLEQLEKAAEAAIHGKRGPWSAVTYSNWRAYGVKNNNGTPGTGYNSRTQAHRPGPEIQKGLVSDIRKQFLQQRQSSDL